MVKQQTPTPRKPGRPAGSGQNYTDAIPRTRATPELRRQWEELGGSEWQRRAVARDYAALMKKKGSSK